MLNFLYTLIIYPVKQIIELSFMVFNDIFSNIGLSVIGVSLAVSVLCLPLYIVAEKWQQLQRDTEKSLEKGIARIKSAFSGDEQYMILSTFYKQNHYSPIMALRSSFGLLIQIPFFIAAYSFLSTLPMLNGVRFSFIRDLSKPDAIFSIGNFAINILPILMTLINIVAGAIYTKGFKAKDKIQIYLMAVVFLVILYNSPSGLVLYWTMNNVFSLVKNIFYKIKNPKKVLYGVLVVVILALDFYALFLHNGFMHKRVLLAAVASVFLLTPLIVKFATFLLDNVFISLIDDKKTRFTLFLTSCIALCLFAGTVIPSLVINSSAVEFMNIDGYSSPLYFIYNSTLQMAGLFIVWMMCIYFLFNARIQTMLSVIMPVLLFISLIDAFIFQGDYGTLSRLMTFSSNIVSAPLHLQILNALCILVAIAVPIFLLVGKKRKIIFTSIVSIILIAEIAISLVNVFQIHLAHIDYEKNIASTVSEEKKVVPLYHFSKTHKNVAVFMFDRSENSYTKPIFDAYPELYDIFDGFTLYKNTASYNQGTLLACPPVYGGYEYTPYEMNKRDNVRLIDKHNEALLLMPRIFTEQADFQATVSDLSWANYSWIADMTICSPYPKITGLNVERKYTDLWVKENPDKVKPNVTSKALKRNLTWLSLFKAVPLFVRDSIYDDGGWWSSDRQTADVMEFLDFYSSLDYLPELTDFSSETDSFFTVTNDTTHSGQKLQPPDYVPTMNLTEDAPKEIRFASVYSNAAMYKRFGEWLEYLKANDCYDNTRIIIVADHGISSGDGRKLDYPKDWKIDWREDYNPDKLHPLLLVKDFNATGRLKISNDFMTNADVPSIALKGIVEKPINPFTNKEIKIIPPNEKKARGVVLTHNWRPGANNLNTFRVPKDDWWTIEKSVFDAKNWTKGVAE